MTEIAHHIDLNLAQKLRNREYRQKFFLAESSAHIAEQLIALRKRRNLDQTQLAEMIGTQQPAISRVEKADYQNWSFNTLRKIADAQDARIRVSIQPAEDVLKEYEPEAAEQPIDKEFVAVITNQMAVEQPAHHNLYVSPWQANQGTRAMDYRHPQGVISFPNALATPLYAVYTFPDTTSEPRYIPDAQEIARLKPENANLKMALLTRVPGSQDSKWAENFEDVDQLLALSFVGQQPPGRAV
jgi:transcriptional regulator with XRE-family HTH domain